MVAPMFASLMLSFITPPGTDSLFAQAPATQSAQAGEAATAAQNAAGLFRAQQEVFRAAARRVAPCVVTIETVGGTQPLEGAPRPATMPGGPGRPRGRPAPPPSFIVADGPTTGLIFSENGLILTSAFNFVRDPSLITVVLPDRRRFVAELLAKDEVRQLAMIRIEASGLQTPTWLESLSEIRVGQWAIALGRGLGGEEPSVTAGIISGLNRQSGLAIQTDARLSPVNYGGPLIDIEGRVIGLCVPMGLTTGIMAGVELYDSGIGFAVPYAQVSVSARDLALGHSLRRGLFGVSLGGPGGLTVTGVADPSPAMRAGIEKGDRLWAVDGRRVRKYSELQRIMRARLAGQRVRLAVQRGGKPIEIPLVLAVPEDLGPIARDQDERPPETQPSPESPEPPRRERE